jgi:hypothetical protein
LSGVLQDSSCPAADALSAALGSQMTRFITGVDGLSRLTASDVEFTLGARGALEAAGQRAAALGSRSTAVPHLLLTLLGAVELAPGQARGNGADDGLSAALRAAGADVAALEGQVRPPHAPPSAAHVQGRALCSRAARQVLPQLGRLPSS